MEEIRNYSNNLSINLLAYLIKFSHILIVIGCMVLYTLDIKRVATKTFSSYAVRMLHIRSQKEMLHSVG